MATIRIPPDFREFLRLLGTHEVRYLLVGGYAVNAFGAIRNTVDMDIWIASDAINLERTVSAIRAFGFTTASEEMLSAEDAMLRMGVPPLRIEVMRKLSGVSFEDCWPRRTEIADGDLKIPMISLDDLRVNKRAAGRPKDLLDLSELA